MKTFNKSLISITTFAFIIFNSFNSSAVTYTTLNEGTWEDINNVWSTDGVNPCNCTPGDISSGINIVVNHDLTVSYNLKFINNSKVNLNGMVLQTNKKITVNNSVLTINGALVHITNSKFHIRGQGNVQMINGAKINVYGTDKHDYLKNEGTIDLCSDCCVSSNKNIKNTGNFLGSGAVVTLGTIDNNNTWSSTLVWCADHGDCIPQSMENCNLSNTICSGLELPVELTNFTAEILHNQYVELEWITVSEIDNDYFKIMKSIDGKQWIELGTVNGVGNSIEKNCYAFEDHELNFKTAYYRLIQVDFSGRESYSPYISVERDSENSEVIIYPNPTSKSQDDLTISNLNSNAGSIYILNDQGQVVNQESIDGVKGEVRLDISKLEPNTYYINVKQCGNSKATKLIVVD